MSPTTVRRAIGTSLVLFLASLAMLMGTSTPARAQATEVQLTGNNANNFFIVRATSATQLQICTDILGCFTRLTKDVQRIAIDGLDGDDAVFISHGDAFVSNPTVPLNLIFDGGVGSDELRICSIDSGCSVPMTTDISVLPDTNELRIVQCLDRREGGVRCVDEPFQQPIPTLKINATGVDVLTDLSTGPLNVVGTPADDVVTIDDGESFTYPQTGGTPAVTGRVSVGNIATVQFLNKDYLTVDSGPGADTITVAGRSGYAALPRTCAPDGAGPVVSLCMRAGDEPGDALLLAPAPADEVIAFDQRDSGVGHLSGLAGPPEMDVQGVDQVQVTLASPTFRPPEQGGSTAGDRFILRGSPGADALAWDATTANALVISGTLRTDADVLAGGTPRPIPRITLLGDGAAAINATLDGGDGPDAVTMTSGPGADGIRLTPAAGSFGAALLHSSMTPGGTSSIPHSAITLSSERLELMTGDGADSVEMPAGLAVDVRWQAGAGPDALRFLGSGAPVLADLGGRRVAQGTDPGITLTEVETWDADVHGSSLTVRGTDAPDTFHYQPVSAAGGTVRRDGDETTVNGSNVSGVLILDPAAGDDLIAIDGTTGADSISITRGQNLTTQLGGLLPGRALPSAEAVVVDGRSGDDTFVVSGQGGTANITVIGGLHTGGDRLSFVLAHNAAALSFDAAPASGTLIAGGPPIAFRDLEHVTVEGDGLAGTAFSVSGSDSDDTIVQEGGTITVGRGTTATFLGFPTLSLHGLAGDDDVVLAPRTLSGVSQVEVTGGNAGTDRVAVIGSSLRETIVYAPEAADRARVEVSLAPAIAMAGVEEVEVDGRTASPSGDTLLVRSPAIDGTVVLTPGEAIDAGSVSLTDAAGTVTSFPPLHYAGLGRGGVVVDGRDAIGTPSDVVRVLGQPDTDVFTLTDSGSGTTSTVLDTRLPISTTGIHSIQLRGLDGQDTFSLPTAHGVGGGGAPAIIIDGGGSSGGDIAVITASGPVTADVATRRITQFGQRSVAFSSLDRVDLDSGGEPTTVLGGDGPESISVRPTAVDGAQVTTDLNATRLDVIHTTALTIDTRAGGDSLAIVGGPSAEAILITRGSLPQMNIGALLPVIATDAVEAISVDGREGADSVTLTGAGGPSSLSVDGGLPASDGDLVRLVASDATVIFDTPPTTGRLDAPGGQTSFAGFDTVDVTGDDQGVLTVRGSDAPDTISLGEPGQPAVRVNGGAAVTHRGYPGVVVDGRAGGDTISVSYSNLGDLQGIDVAGGNALDDVIRVVDSLAASRRWQVAPQDGDRAVISADAMPTINASGVAQVQLVGRAAGDRVELRSPAGGQDVLVQPGGASDAGTMRVGSLVPVVFSDLGADGVLVLTDASPGPQDLVVIDGTASADSIDVTGADRGIRRSGFLPVLAEGASTLTIRGYEGVDTFTATGPLPWATTTFNGGGPDRNDKVRLSGPAGDAVVNIAQAQIDGFGGAILVPEVEVLETQHAQHALTMVGTDRDDAMCVDPLTPRDGRVHIIASPGGGLLSDSCQPAPGSLDLLHTFIDVGRLLLDPGPGVDQVLVNGTVGNDAVTVASTGQQVRVSVNPIPTDTGAVRLPVDLVTATTENLVVSTDNGLDNIDVRLQEGPAPAITVHGEAPTTSKADYLYVRDLSGGASLSKSNGSISGSGVVRVSWAKYSGAEVFVSYTGIEEVKMVKMSRPR